ncbi:hypothetical protein ACOSQ3_028734 [Xanthoceras sorbifolium]
MTCNCEAISINKDEFVNEKYKVPIFIGINGRMANCSSGLLGIIVRNTLNFIPVVPLLALKLKKDLSEIALEKPRKTWDSLGTVSVDLPITRLSLHTIYTISIRAVLRDQSHPSDSIAADSAFKQTFIKSYCITSSSGLFWGIRIISLSCSNRAFETKQRRHSLSTLFFVKTSDSYSRDGKCWDWNGRSMSTFASLPLFLPPSSRAQLNPVDRRQCLIPLSHFVGIESSKSLLSRGNLSLHEIDSKASVELIQ